MENLVLENKTFDVFVVGSGSAGQTCALSCANAGLSVAIADDREYGGTCANRGCDPKKVMLTIAEQIHHSKQLKKKGVTRIPGFSMKDLQKFKKTFTRSIPAGTEEKLVKAGVILFHQSPKILEDGSLLVEGKKFNAKRLVIATGLRPRNLAVKGAKYLKTSDDLLNLKKVPPSIVFIGGGYIAMEFAHLFNTLGSAVTIIERGDRPLKHFDEDLVSILKKESERRGINFITNAGVRRISKLRKNVQIEYKSEEVKKRLKARIVINAAGRIPSLDGLQLENIGVAHDQSGVQVNDYLQSVSNPDVYACGDVSNHSLPLTPLSGLQGSIVAQNIINGNKSKIDHSVVPSTVFTFPNIAKVGLSEAQAQKRYTRLKIVHAKIDDWFNARRLNDRSYSYKIIYNDRTDEVLGAQLLGPNASETINLFAMAIEHKIKIGQLKDMIFTYPSLSNDIRYMI